MAAIASAKSCIVYFADALVLDTGRPVAGGFMAYRAKAARVGHYEYSGRDVDPDNKFGLRDQAIVNVARYSEDVHDPKSAHSFIGKPITDDHPRDAVTRDNWRDHARGTVMGAKWEEGGYLAFDLMLTDGTAIDKVAAGKRELSNGYSCDLVHGEFTATDGVECQFKQTNIRGNHVAIVDRGRAGSECAIRDAAACDSAPRSIFDSLTTDGAAEAIAWLKKAIALHKKHMDGTAPTTGSDGEKSQMLMMTQMKNALSELESGSSGKSMKMDQSTYGAPAMKTMLIDGLTVDVSNADTAMATIQTLVAARDAANGKVTALEAQAVTDAATIVAKDAEIAKLTADLAAAKPTLQQLRDAGKAFALIEGKAKAAGVTVTDAMDEAAIMKAVVDKAMPNNTYEGDHVRIAFDALTKDVKVEESKVVPIGAPLTNDAAAEYAASRDKRKAEMSDAWRKPFNAADAAAA